MISRLSACLDMLFTEEPVFADRVRRASDAGFEAAEFWRWTNKDFSSLKAALDETGMRLSGFVAEPMVALTDRDAHQTFLAGLKDSAARARDLDAPFLIAQTGNLLADRPREAQRAALVECLTRSADLLSGTGVRLLVEPLNTRVDHPGYFLHSTAEGLDIIEAVARPEVRLLYDLYHSFVMDERPQEVLAGRLGLVAHLHLADAPGRHEPGSGVMDWRERLNWIVAHGYDGALGLEYAPTGTTEESAEPLLAWHAAEFGHRADCA